MIRLGTLFSGIGAVEQALIRLGVPYDIIFACDNGDIDIDVLTGGPPCQSFSLAGERRKNDKKDDLFSYYLKVIEAIRPKYFIMENVYGILTKDNGKVRERILREIRNIVDFDHLQEFVNRCEAAELRNEELKLSLKV